MWHRFNNGLPNVMIWDMAIDRGATTLSLWTRSRGAYAWPLPLGPEQPLPTTLAVDPATGNNIGTLTLSATLTSGGNPVSGKTITFSANSRDGGSAITDANGVASVVVSFTPPGAGQKDSAPPDPRPRAPGTYPGGAVANFTGDSIYATATGSNTLIVLPKPK